MTKTILITGGSGVLGKKLLYSLIDDFKIIAIGKSYANFPNSIRFHKNFKFYERDLTKINSIEDFMIPESVDLILHLAAVVSGIKVTEEFYHQINVNSTKLLVEFAKSKNIPHFGFVSSVSVYGSKEVSLEIGSERTGKTIYAKTKALAEDFVLNSSEAYSVFRMASIYGKSTKSFISKLRSLAKLKIYPYISSDRKKSLIHIEDASKALALWTKQTLNGKSTQPVYVFSHPEFVTVNQVIRTFQELGIIGKFLIPIPVGGVWGKIVELMFRFISFIRRKPFHGSPLQPLLESVAIYDEQSFANLGFFPEQDLRKGLTDYQL
ncbi:NAD(P)-dependent oxidoreductase [Leptospira sp. 2 VSF19]|uniref:NAD(P)-dependent oxidoreductase n=1 Tax=Leptospira soteropolitanensis TaxID=2950025 RepID=A0AAW5VJS3_9LEPT|nr:NAD(P)-dependent oxidoreductase [Leptospira soteropolitanensis]MCW7494559.1 NAD(P)-dependent oxidoreductase [Leptospira soteropolitanensis]MCW7502153.1 NAD(P)-dependent oxidoreductase [Leptospira soteropolitanensis]MCW7524417.1 NAD(P)-dependent oxidoreductase [Leptospira soteropolitanensis]MCW7528283.1 NAD(P)-dependent oxidoreductase [Leptospira soteropolitanensis]MCW7532123.1 NAD(P)-dependent oxidoreductase [Leptospira soteropolitanensis]